MPSGCAFRGLPNTIFQQDNARLHVAHGVLNFLDTQGRMMSRCLAKIIHYEVKALLRSTFTAVVAQWLWSRTRGHRVTGSSLGATEGPSSRGTMLEGPKSLAAQCPPIDVLVDIHLIYGLAEENVRVAVRLYRERYPQNDTSGIRMFANFHPTSCEYASVQGNRHSEGEPHE
ncbi:hypothetical protein TNCV_1517671 [Trichonephila clavipes]|nr:hypothetical protein TNCV_1517671 [Trichonephila clavipes]